MSLGRFDGPDSLGGLHSAATRLSSQFDHYSEEVTWRLEEALANLDSAQSRLGYELEALESDVQSLVKDVQEAAMPPDSGKQVSSSAATIERLETARSRMEEVMTVFKNARDFDEDKITREVLELAGHNDGGRDARNRIAQIRNLIDIWKGTTVYSSRLRFANGLSKRVEAIVGARAEQDSRRPSSDIDRSTRETTPSDGYYSLINQFQRKIF
jgi:hypothetical protein